MLEGDIHCKEINGWDRSTEEGESWGKSGERTL